ncbi:MAG TPA: V-type ATPase subunit [Thermoplasmataceae archaeon]|nr:V-type ATPase subunit [Thermoplasmatales archaeon AK]HLH86658.1 V-type ATPase subunit [Thermoplasmataceae archaeon]
MDPTYAGAFGRLKAHETEFLSPNDFSRLIEAKNTNDILSILFSTFYKSDIEVFSGVHKGAELLNMSINHRLILRNRYALFAAPTPARDLLRAYLSKWDIENIKAIISSKFMGYSVRETEDFLLSFRDIPMGIFAGPMTHEDFRNLMSKESIEAMVNYLTNFGYGQFVLQQMDRYRKSGDVSFLLSALDFHYYSNLISSVRFYNGDEGPVIRYVMDLVDAQNLFIILKGLDLKLEYERIREYFIPGGNRSLSALQEVYSLGSIEEVAKRFQNIGNLERAVRSYISDKRLQLFEVIARADLYGRYIPIFRQQALSLSYTLSFILTAERERELLHYIILGKDYGLDNSKIREMLQI